jgi:hypothetical protein
MNFSNSINSITNTYNKFSAKGINENHNTRPEILLAVLGQSGIGQTERFSTSGKASTRYHAMRLGSNTNFNLCTFRVNMDTTA